MWLRLQACMLHDPPCNTTLALVHAVKESRGADGGCTQLAYIHSSRPISALESMNAIVLSRLAVPAQLLNAPGLVSPYMALFNLAAEGTGSAVMKSRRNLLRTSQAGGA